MAALTLQEIESKKEALELLIATFIYNEVGKFQVDCQVGVESIEINTTHTANINDERTSYHCIVNAELNPKELEQALLIADSKDG